MARICDVSGSELNNHTLASEILLLFGFCPAFLDYSHYTTIPLAQDQHVAPSSSLTIRLIAGLIETEMASGLRTEAERKLTFASQSTT